MPHPAPNLYLEEWKKSLLDDEDLVEYTRHISKWLQYIYDIFVIWEGSEAKLLEFFKRINSNDHNLKFTMTYDRDSVTFLVLRVKTNIEGKLSSTLSWNSTAGNTVLHATSFHPPSLKTSIPYGQYLRLHHTCSTDTLFREEAGKLQSWLLQRGYSRSCLRKAYNTTIRKSQLNLLF